MEEQRESCISQISQVIVTSYKVKGNSVSDYHYHYDVISHGLPCELHIGLVLCMHQQIE